MIKIFSGLVRIIIYFEIAVDDVLGMEVLDTCHNLIEVFDGIFFRLGIFIDQPIEVAIISKFHEQEDLVLHFEVIIESDDVGMLQFFMEPDFSLDEFELS